MSKPTLLLIACGGYGDGLMFAGLLPSLAQKYQITLLATPSIAMVYRHDPHLASIKLIEKKGKEMVDEWMAEEAKHDHTVNLANIITGPILKNRSRLDYYWPQHQRLPRLWDLSFINALQDEICRVLERPVKHGKITFYPSTAEQAAAAQLRERTGPFIYWQLTGSSHHKDWERSFDAAELLARQSGLSVIFGCGNQTERERNIRTAAAYFVRDRVSWVELEDHGDVRLSMTTAQLASLVVGPETGLMWAVAAAPMPKIMFLSHCLAGSYADAFTNTQFLTALERVPCYPCYRIHATEEFCPTVNGGAICQNAITLEQLVDAAAKVELVP